MVFEHEHPLSLIDLQPEDLDYEEDDEESENLTTKESDFRCQCDRCHQEINWFHRYYYKCDQCDYSIHKFCAELPATLQHASHVHTLFLLQRTIGWRCHICGSHHEPEDLLYGCSQRRCYFNIDVHCATKWLKTNIIHHPSHMHPLACFIKEIKCECDACGKVHEGVFYLCNTCPFIIGRDCAFLSKTLLIQQTTNGVFYHTHPLALAYSFSIEDQRAKFKPRCRVCGKWFYNEDLRIYNENLWIYKCDKCRYYTHLDCATSRGKPKPGLGKTIKDFADADYPDLLHFPFPDQTYSILKHKFFEKFASYDEVTTHMSHPHPLNLVTTQCNDIAKPTSSNFKPSSCHNPMKKIELLCNGCVKPITDMPFYECAKSCNFVLHVWCTRLPTQVETHTGHPEHTLVFQPNAPDKFLGVFRCDICRLDCNGFSYSCVECNYHVDVSCAFIPEKIVHEAHPNHLLWRVKQPKVKQPKPNDRKYCRSCGWSFAGNTFVFSCRTCDFSLHNECALLLPQTIRHKFDKHPMKLSYFPIENHKSQYFCEICEMEFDPEQWFYHCYECAQSIHSDCSPLILECERASQEISSDRDGIYKFLNIKFGGIHNIKGHQHPLSFVQAIASDGNCRHFKCRIYPRSLHYRMIFKCLQCKFAIHFACYEDFQMRQLKSS